LALNYVYASNLTVGRLIHPRFTTCYQRNARYLHPDAVVRGNICTFALLGGVCAQNIGVTSIKNRHGRAPEEFTARGAEFDLLRNQISPHVPSKALGGLFSGYTLPTQRVRVLWARENEAEGDIRTLLPEKWWTGVFANME
jgi:hypothetical protein